MFSMTFKAAAVAAVATLGASAASAATFDFAAIADVFKDANGGTEATFEQLNAFDSSLFSNGGVTIIDMGAGGPDLSESQAFFDGTDGSGPAGLGVCSSGFESSGLSSCSSAGGAVPGDDNVTEFEFVDIFFDKAVKVTDLLFRNETHGRLDGIILIDFTQYLVTNGVLSEEDLNSIRTLDVLAFDYADGVDGAAQFYVSSISVAPVPLPAGIVLLLSALGGLGIMRRRAA